MGKIKKLAALAAMGVKHPEMVKKGLRYLKENGLHSFLDNANGKAEWKTYYSESAHTQVRFSILMPVYNVPIQWLDRAVDSVRRQLYPNWELYLVDDCSTQEEVRDYLKGIQDERIKVKLLEKNRGISGATNEAAAMATGDFLVLMDNDDELSDAALHEFKQQLDREEADILYSDQDIVDEQGVHREPLCKPDWSPDLLMSQMYIGHLLGFKKSLFEQVGGFRDEYNGSQDYDLMLRMTEITDKIAHVPSVVYSWRALPSSTAANPGSKPYAQIVGQKALQDHVDRVYGSGRAVVHETDQFFVYDVRYPLEKEPLVSVIIPTKDHVELLKGVIHSIEEKTVYKNYELIIINNNSQEQETLGYLGEISQKDNITVVDAPIPFNWSKLNNLGMEHARGDVFLFMNNDMTIITEDWMTRLAEKALLPHTGVVGGLLLYEDGTIQHAGVVISMKGWADHVFKGMTPVHYGSPFVSPMVVRDVSAVTGACMAVSRAVIERIGKFDEDFIICGSDIELCVRASQAGLYNIYDPYVQLYHLESKSRDSFIPAIDFELSDKAYEPFRLHGDPFFNPHLDIHNTTPTYREMPVTAKERMPH